MSEPQPAEIRSPVQIVKVQTLADGGLRFTFDAGEGQVLTAAHLMECKRRGVPGWLTFEPDWGAVGSEGDKPPQSWPQYGGAK